MCVVWRMDVYTSDLCKLLGMIDGVGVACTPHANILFFTVFVCFIIV